MPRGGKRTGTSGTSYSNRTDLNAQPIRVAPAQQYGDATRQRQAQQAMPLAQTPPTPAPTAPAASATPQSAPQLGGLYDPSMRTDEPVQAGLSQGPGEGPMAGPTARDILAAVYRQFPDDDIRRLLEQL